MKTKWFEGVWLGHNRGSNEPIVGTERGAVKAWAVRRRPSGERWSNELVSNMKGTPEKWKAEANTDQADKPTWTDADNGEGAPSTGEVRRPPKMYLKMKDFKRYGYTRECPGCVRMGRKAKPPYYHNDECRRRIEKMVFRDDAQRCRRAEMRRNHEDRQDSTDSE